MQRPMLVQHWTPLRLLQASRCHTARPERRSRLEKSCTRPADVVRICSLLENYSVTNIITEKLIHLNLLQIKHMVYYSIGW